MKNKYYSLLFLSLFITIDKETYLKDNKHGKNKSFYRY
jgi:hypothetical protein